MQGFNKKYAGIEYSIGSFISRKRRSLEARIEGEGVVLQW